MEEQKAEPKETPKKEAKPKRARRTKSVKKAVARVEVVKSKRKEAVARARIKEGSGAIRVNRIPIEKVEPQEARRLMMEPISVSSMTMELAKSSDIELNVKGGGRMGQAQAARSAIAKALAKYDSSDTIRKEYMKHDRSMIIDDPRRVESKKFKGPKARARFQTSYR